MIVITGASGFIGQQLVEQLKCKSVMPLLLVSRDRAALARQFPDAEVTDYAGLATQDLRNAHILHLAARNNDAGGDAAAFAAANVDHLIATARTARAAGAAKFSISCSTHALNPDPDDLYGLSKRDGAQRLAAMWPAGAVNLYLPAVVGKQFQGRLALLNRLPSFCRSVVLGPLRQVKPVIAVDQLVNRVVELMTDTVSAHNDHQWAEVYLADPVPTAGLYAFAKRTIDLSACAAIALLLGWAMLVIAALVRLDSKGAAIFAQARVGRNGRVFTCYKFRTMSLGTTQVATHEVSASSITRIGAVLRRTKLDELPQIANVFMNQMSLVGPRPCLPVQSELVALRKRREVLQLKPGITGLAQINNVDMSDPARLAAWDSRYAAYRTLLLDCIILLRTVSGRGAGDRVRLASNLPND
ncbi:MAG: NAD-dependent epimerase/dehydratase family protein [Sphingopyxis sp.]|nr:NAD-dependent epimerase/dehydratase family protein [Sphingopyxis sp.]